MATRIPVVALCLIALTACSSPAPDAEAATSKAPVTGSSGYLSSDLYARGFTREDFPRMEQIAEGVYVYQGAMSNAGTWFTLNTLVVVGTDGVLISDGHGNPEETKKLVDKVKEVTGREITHVVIGNDHPTHRGGDAALPAGVQVFAHPSSAAVLEARRKDKKCVMWQPYHGGIIPCVEGADRVLTPTEIVRDKKVLDLGGRQVEILHLGRSRTGGDLFVYLPKEKILSAEQAFLPGFFPAYGPGFPSEWLEVIDKMQAMDVDYYVPGHGFLESPDVLKAQLEEQEQAMRTVFTEVKRLHDAGVPVEEAVAQARFGNNVDGRTLRGNQAPGAIRKIYVELDGKLPPKVQ